MKILKGSLKGRNLLCPAHIRPVSTLVRKACFDILGDEVIGKRILDLFAGSGSLGIEALSSGSKEAVFVDIKKNCVEVIRRNLLNCKLLPKARVYLKDAFIAMKDFASHKTFDIIFLDPPYYKGMLKKSLQTLEEYDIVTPSGFVVSFCYRKDEFISTSKTFTLITTKRYGSTMLLIYRRQTTEDSGQKSEVGNQKSDIRLPTSDL